MGELSGSIGGFDGANLFIGGFKKIKWAWKPPKQDTGLAIRFFRSGPYKNQYETGIRQEPFLCNYQAFYPHAGDRGKGGYIQCSCYNGLIKEARCVPHAMVLKSSRGQKVPMPMPHFALCVLLLGDWHYVQVEEVHADSDRIDTRREWMRCTKHELNKCEACEAGAEVIHGRREYYNPGTGHWTILCEWDRQIGAQFCKCGMGKPYRMDLHCKTCGTVVWDTSIGQPVNPDTEKKGRIYCATCGAERPLEETLQCRVAQPDGSWTRGCEKPIRAGIFDVDFHSVYTVGKDKDTTLMHGGWSPPHAIPEIYKDATKPFDFLEMFKISSEAQARLMNVPNPFGAEGTSGGGVKY